MSPRMFLLRELFLLAIGVAGVIVLSVASALTLGGMFSWVWFARAILICALVFSALEFLVIQRALRVTHQRGVLSMWRVNDRAQGCTVALVGALIAASLLLCGGLMEWWVEWK